MQDYKAYNLGNGWGIECYFYENPYTGVRRYQIDVIILGLPFKDVRESVISYDKDEANRLFKALVEKYRSF